MKKTLPRRLTTSLLLILAPLAIGCARYAAAHSENGDRYFKQQKYREAIEEYGRAARFQPDNAHAIRQLGLAHHRLGNEKDAFTFLVKSRELDPNDLEVRLTLGGMYLAASMPDDAVREANAVLGKRPTNLDALNLLGSA